MGYHGISWDIMGYHGISWDYNEINMDKPSDHELYLLRMVPAVKVVVNTSAFFAGAVWPQMFG